MENGNKKSLISSIIFCVVLFLQSGCTSEIEIENIGNGKSEVHDVRPPFTIRATVSSFTGLEVTDKLSIGNPSTRYRRRWLHHCVQAGGCYRCLCSQRL